MKIANIVSKSNINVSEEINVVDSIDKIINGIPTLIVGFDYVESLYPNFNVLNREVVTSVYWTTKKSEKRDKYEEDLDWFIRHVYDDLFSKVTYVFIDPIVYSQKNLRKIIKKIYLTKNLVTFHYNDMLYMHCDEIIFGLDLKLLKFVGLNEDRVKNKIKEKSSVFLRDKEILIEYKNTIENIDGKIRYIPYLYSIKNEQNDITSMLYIPRET